MKTSHLQLCAWSAAGLLLSATAGSGQTIQPLTEATSKDAKIYSGVPNGPLASNLNITSSNIGAHFLSLVQFDLTQLNATNSDAIISATLRLYSNGVGASGGPALGGTVTLSPILDNWRETTDAPGSAPVASYDAFFGYTDVDDNLVAPTLHYGSPVASVNISGAGFYDWDLTSTVKSWYNNSLPNYGVLIELSSGGGDIGLADVDSAPGVAGSAPSLNVIPEPSSAISLFGGAGLLFLLRRRTTRAMA